MKISSLNVYNAVGSYFNVFLMREVYESSGLQMKNILHFHSS